MKAESDICCTSSNAADVVASIPEDREILFLPDQFLGAHVERQTGRKMHIWMGECHVHAGIQPGDLQAKLAAEPDAELLVHPECGCTTNVMWLLGEGELPADRTKVLVDRRDGDRGGALGAPPVPRRDRDGHPAPAAASASPGKEFVPVDRKAECKYMKMITPENLLTSLRDGVFEIDVPRDIAERARHAVERMIAIGPTAGRTVPAGPVFGE